MQLSRPAARQERPFFPALLRRQVLLAVAELLGCVSVPALGGVTDKFLLEMGRRIKADSSGPARQQLFWMLQVGAGGSRWPLSLMPYSIPGRSWKRSTQFACFLLPAASAAHSLPQQAALAP